MQEARSRFFTILLSYKIACQIRRNAVAGYTVGAVAEVIGSIVAIYATAKIAGLLVAYLSTGETSMIWFWFAVDVVAAITSALGFWLMRYNTRLIYFSAARWATNKFVAKMSEIDAASFDDSEIRSNINKVAWDYSWRIPDLISSSLDLAYGVLRFVAITFVVSQIAWWLVPLIVVFLLPSLLAESQIAKIQWFVFNEKGDERHVFWGLASIIKQRSKQLEIRAMQARTYINQKIDNLNKRFISRQENKYKRANRFIVPAKVTEVTGVAVGSFVLIKQFLDKTISLDQFLFLSGALLRVGGALNGIFGTLTRMQDSLLFVQTYLEVLDIPVQSKDKSNAVQLKSKSAPLIEFKDVSFHYPQKSAMVFENLNLTIKPGQHVALVGENGAGKTTLIKLLLRFYEPTSGKILVDGIDIQHIAIESLYDKIATLFQDFNQYPFSIQENIEVGRPGYSDDKKLQNAANSAGVTKFTKKYEHGFDTVLDASFKNGVEPSGGQWQRVALARAFYRDADILILDEPTAAIDAKAEYDIFNNIFEHYKDKTAIIVSHRFSTVRRADAILVIENGEIREQGSHEDLMKQKNLYHEMFSKQAEGYKN
jgi:ATP-binding cassette subfamily B protein